MKKLVVILSMILAGCCASKSHIQRTPNDTLQWLKINIEKKNSFYSGKPLQVLLDTLAAHSLTSALLDYTSPIISDDAPANSLPGEIVKTNHFTIFMGEVFGGGAKAQIHEDNSSVNTHIPWISLTFTQQIPFPSSMLDDPILGHRWTKRTANLCGPYIIQKVTVGEY